MALHPEVAKHINEIRDASERYGIEKLEIFGSAMTDKFDLDRSDVDFIVHYPEGYVFGYFGKQLFDMEQELSDILGRPAQLVMTSALKRQFFRQNADLTRVTIYVADESESTAFGHKEAMPTYR